MLPFPVPFKMRHGHECYEAIFCELERSSIILHLILTTTGWFTIIKILLGNLQSNFVSQCRIQYQNSLGIHYLCSFFPTLNLCITHCMAVGVQPEWSASLWKKKYVEEYNEEKYCKRKKNKQLYIYFFIHFMLNFYYSKLFRVVYYAPSG